VSGLHVDFFNVRIVLGGPKRSEDEARRRLAQVLYEGIAEGYEKTVRDENGEEKEAWEGLSECLYLADSGFAEREAMKIAYETNPETGLPYVQFQVKGNKIRIAVISLTATYTNTGKPTKYWARIIDGVQTVEPGDLY